MRIQQFNLSGINAYNNPLNTNGEFLRAVNVDSYPNGGIKKRPGYTKFLGGGGTDIVTDIFQWTNDSGSQSYLYAKKGSVLQYYDVTAGTGDWTNCGNGTFSGTTSIGHGVLENVLIIGNGVDATRHTTNGTSFTNTTLAPIANQFEQYQQRIYAVGTANTLFYSTTGDATNWSAVAPSDSSSIQIPGEGAIIDAIKIADKLQIHKAGRNIFRWDGYLLEDLATKAGMSSFQSFSKIEDYGIWLTRDGIYGSSGDRPELISNAVQPWIYNDFGGGINGHLFDFAPAASHRFDYYLGAGDITDDVTHETIHNAVLKYNYQKNMWFIYSLADNPTAFGEYQDNAGVKHLLFGDNGGQVYIFGEGATDDDGAPIEAITEMVVTGNDISNFKVWKEYSLFFNPGSKAKVQIGMSDTFRRDSIRLKEIGDTSIGALSVRFPVGSRSKLLYVKVYENSKGPAWIWYGHAVDFDVDDTI